MVSVPTFSSGSGTGCRPTSHVNLASLRLLDPALTTRVTFSWFYLAMTHSGSIFYLCVAGGTAQGTSYGCAFGLPPSPWGFVRLVDNRPPEPSILLDEGLVWRSVTESYFTGPSVRDLPLHQPTTVFVITGTSLPPSTGSIFFGTLA
jgi:hypothetical protein